MKKTLLIKVSNIFKPLVGPNRYVSGIGRSTYQLLEAISRIEELPFDIKLYGAGLSSVHRKAGNLPFSYNSFPLPMKLGADITTLESFYLKHINRHSLLHIPHNYDYALTNGINFIVTIHDTCEYDMVLREGRQERVDVWKYAAYNSKEIITCSQCSKQDIIDRFGVPEDKVVVIPWGISTEMFHRITKNAIKSILDKYGIERDYFLAVSCANERKNISNLLKAFRNYVNVHNETSMVLLWSAPPEGVLIEYEKEIKAKQIVFLNYVSDEDLVALYNGAIATMYPSRYEGFGFPVLESFACGTPVMTCNNSSLSEVGGDLAVFVGEDNVDEMTQAMEMLTSRYDFEGFRRKAENYIKRFSWRKTAEKYVDLYSKALEEWGQVH